jgi:tRNA threonylcarbamoyladenosine biosynthesis protein TsaE
MIRIQLDESALRKWGRVLGAAAARDSVFVALFGVLGSGKTTFVQAACEGAGVSGGVTSPTYTLVHWYYGERGLIAHADLYRINSTAELLLLGWEDLESGRATVFVEWADRAADELPPDRWELWLEVVLEGRARVVEAKSFGAAPPIPDPKASARMTRLS